jgi:hypothetical protein
VIKVGIGDEVLKLESENKMLRDIVADIVLIGAALDQLKQVVGEVVKKLADLESGVIPIEPSAEVVVVDSNTDQVPPGPQDSRYQLTEIGGDEQKSVPYKVDSSQYLPGGDF